MKNILLVTPHFKYGALGGGAQKSIELIYDSLKYRYNFRVICLKTLAEEEYITKFSLIKLFKFLVKRENYDLIYLNSFFSPLCILFNLIYFFNKKIIISPKGELYEGALKTKKIKKFIWINFFKIINYKRSFHVTSKNEEKILKKFFLKSKIYLARDIIKLNFRKFQKKKSNNYLKLVYISRIDRKKNLLFLYEVLKQVKTECVFKIYGDYSDKDYFDEIINKFSNLPQNIKWSYNGVLEQKDVNKIFSKSDIFLFPTLGENFGYIIFESLLNYCSVFLSSGTTPFKNLKNFLVGHNIDLKDPNIWSNHINNYKSLNSEKNFKNYLNKLFNEKEIINENIEMFEKKNLHLVSRTSFKRIFIKNFHNIKKHRFRIFS